MTRYDYVGMRESGEDRTYEAQDEIYINGQSITSQIDGYTQISVDGLDSQPYVVDSMQTIGRSGSRPTGYRTGEFDVTIRYLIRAETSVELQEKKDQLGDILRQGALQVSFKHDERYIYKDVYYTGVGGGEETSNNKVSTFTLTFYDPFKYEKEQSVGEVVIIDGEFVEVDEIKVEFVDTISRPIVRINNGLYHTSFRLVGTYNAGDIFRLIVHNDTGLVSEVGGTVEIGTLPRELVVFNGATGSVVDSSNSVVEFKWRGFRS